MSIQSLRKFIREVYEMMKTINQENVKTSKKRVEIPVHEMINKIFAEYNFAE
jgi:hypothetical protein